MTASPLNSNDQFGEDFRRATLALDQQQEAEQRAVQRGLENETDATLNRRPLRTLARSQAPSSEDRELDRARQLADEAFQAALQPDRSEPRQRSIAMF